MPGSNALASSLFAARACATSGRSRLRLLSGIVIAAAMATILAGPNGVHAQASPLTAACADYQERMRSGAPLTLDTLEVTARCLKDLVSLNEPVRTESNTCRPDLLEALRHPDTRLAPVLYLGPADAPGWIDRPEFAGCSREDFTSFTGQSPEWTGWSIEEFVGDMAHLRDEAFPRIDARRELLIQDTVVNGRRLLISQAYDACEGVTSKWFRGVYRCPGVTLFREQWQGCRPIQERPLTDARSPLSTDLPIQTRIVFEDGTRSGKKIITYPIIYFRWLGEVLQSPTGAVLIVDDRDLQVDEAENDSILSSALIESRTICSY